MEQISDEELMFLFPPPTEEDIEKEYQCWLLSHNPYGEVYA